MLDLFSSGVQPAQRAGYRAMSGVSLSGALTVKRCIGVGLVGGRGHSEQITYSATGWLSLSRAARSWIPLPSYLDTSIGHPR